MSRRKKASVVPSYDKMLIPTLEALKILGGSGSNQEINQKVYDLCGFNEDVLSISQDETGAQSKVDYRLSWARTYLKKFGLIDNSARGIWVLIDNELDISKYSGAEIAKTVRDSVKKSNLNAGKDEPTEIEAIELEADEQIDWKQKLIHALLKIDASAFERLCQRMLRESGFIQVEVTGKSGDGGIDGKGIVRINGFLSFHVFFQCKRYKGSVSSGDIRDFRGAMQGRADKGLFITTGSFTRDAKAEAIRDGAPPIDLIDGEELCLKLKEFRLGVKVELIEDISVVNDWFDRL